MRWIMENWDDLVLIVTGLVTVASIIVKLTPSKTDDELLAAVRRFVERLALNGEPTKPPATPQPPRSRPPYPAILFLVAMGAVLSACAPVAAERDPGLTQACLEAATTLQRATAARDAGQLSDAAGQLADQLVAAAGEPCSDHDLALPGDAEVIRAASDELALELAR
ncbi:MAG: hypothetical protein RJA36_1454 [Pseudomonadota bacterium]